MSGHKEEAPAAPAAEGQAAKSGPPIMVVGGALLAVLFAGGFGLAYFVLPGKIAAQLKAELAAPADAGEHGAAAGGHGEAAAGHEAPKAGDHAAPAAGGHAEAKPAEGGHGEAKPAEGGHGGGGAEAGKSEKPTEFKVENLIVNVSGSRAGRFVKVSLSFEAEPDVLAELAKKKARITDIVGSTLAAKTEEQLRAPTARGALRTEILGALNPLLEKGQIQAVFFLEYLIQP